MYVVIKASRELCEKGRVVVVDPQVSPRVSIASSNPNLANETKMPNEWCGMFLGNSDPNRAKETKLANIGRRV